MNLLIFTKRSSEVVGKNYVKAKKASCNSLQRDYKYIFNEVSFMHVSFNQNFTLALVFLRMNLKFFSEEFQSKFM